MGSDTRPRGYSPLCQPSYCGRGPERVRIAQGADELVRWPGSWAAATREARLQSQCDEALELLKIAISFHPPSRGYYWLSPEQRLCGFWWISR